MTPLLARAGALAGIAAAAVALGVAEVVAVLTGPRSAPLIAVGGAVVDAAPPALKQFAIDVFGVYDKAALLIGTAVLLAGFAALIGVAATRSRWYGLAGIAVFAAVGVVAAVTRPGAGPAAALPALLGSAAGLAILYLLLTSPTPVAAAPGAGQGAAGQGAAGQGAAGQGAAAPGVAPAPAPVPGPAPAAALFPAAVPGAAPAPFSAAGQAAAAVTGSGPGESPRRRWPDGWPRRAAGPGSPDADRRRFLRTAGVAVGVAAAAGLGGRWLSSRRGVELARAAVGLPVPVEPAPPVPVDAELSVPRLASFVTPNDRFYRIDTALIAPQVDPVDWQLRIHGRVRNPVTLSFADLLARPMVERHITLACVSNEVGGDLVGNARWLGVRVRDLLDEAQPLDGADQVVSRSIDGWTCGTPTALLRDGRDALLAVGMNGQPLPVEHGFPVRMVVPGLYGYVSACKWLTELELTSFADFDAYWVPRGWSAQGPIKTQSRIDTPRGGGRLTAGPVTVAGVAWAQRRGVAAVHVSVDGGPWQPAALAGTVSVDTWRQWRWQWSATPGSHTLRVRATDATGRVQTGDRAPVAPDGATGWHTITVDVA